jgi:protein-disulfide isomerase
MDDTMQLSENSKPQTSSRFDPLALATLIAVVVLVTISAVNLWNLRQLQTRVSTIEAAFAPRRTGGPDLSRVYTIKTVGAQAKGPETAPVTIVEFSDFQCPFCASVVPTLKQIEDTYKERVRIVWKHLPLPIHKDAVGASLAAEAAGNQGKFWEFHDRLFADQNKLGPEDLKQHAKELALDLNRFEADLLDAQEKQKIDADVAEARALDIKGTPGIFINGRFVAGAQPFSAFAKIINEELTKRNLPVPAGSPSN